MTKKIAILFFIVSILILITLGFLIVKENTVSTDSAKVEGCTQIEKYKFAENIRVLWSDTKYFVSFDDISKTVQLNVWTLKDKKFSFEKISELKMQCDRPDYNCIAKSVEFEVSQFTPPYGLVEYKFNGSVKKMPFSWNSQKELKLGPPLNLCGKNVAEIEKAKIFWIQNDLFIYDYNRNIIGQYSMSQLRGTSPASAAVDSKRALVIDDEGLIQPTTCENILANKVAAERHHIHVEKDQVLVYKTNSAGTVYTYQADFIPRFKTAYTVYKSVIDDQHNTIYYTDSKNLYTLPVGSLKEEAVENTEKSLNYVQLSQSTTTEFAAYSKSFNKLIAFNSKAFSTDLLTIMNLNTGSNDKIRGNWRLLNKNTEYFSTATLNASDAFYFLKKSTSASEFVAARCSP